MYLISCLLLLLFVYVSPALAVNPKLILKPLHFAAIPILSSLFIVALTTLLLFFHLFNPWVVTFLSILLLFIAAFRVHHLLTLVHNGFEKFKFKPWHIAILIFNFAFILPYFAKLGAYSFDRGDEIYSWNFWAVQHFLSLPIDFSHTGAPYPQFFPKLLAFCYQLLGSIELQLPVKGMLFLFPFTLLNALAFSFNHASIKRFIYYLLLMTFLVYVVGLRQFFNDGYADPVMTTCLVMSIALFWHAMTKRESVSLWLSLLAGMAAAYAKQPALLWLGVGFPILLLAHNRGRKRVVDTLPMIIIIVLAVAFCGVWAFTEGHGFQDNQSVILSTGKREVLTQLAYAFNRYLFHHIPFALLLVTAGLLSFNTKLTRNLFLLVVVPSLLLWFYFGAYQFRLGQHIAAICALLIVCTGYRFPEYIRKTKKVEALYHKLDILLQHYQNNIKLKGSYLLTAFATLSCLVTLSLFIKVLYFDKSFVPWYAGGYHTLSQYFGSDAKKIYQTLYDKKDITLWVPTRYLYGIFYQHTKMVTPVYSTTKPYTMGTLLNQLKTMKPDYVFVVSEDIIDGPASPSLKKLISQCPQLFIPFSKVPNRYDYAVYQVNYHKLDTKNSCRLNS